LSVSTENKPTRRQSTDERLDAEAWVDAALTELGAAGIDGVRVEVLAKRLSVTKGSFYWHFKDRDALFVAMLNRWRRRATLALIERLESGHASAEDRLRRLLKLPLLGQRSASAADLELSIRLWGRRDERAQAALMEVDELRLRYIGRLLQELGVSPEEAAARATLSYCYMRVAPTLIPSGALSMMKACEDVLLGSEQQAA